MVLTPGTELGPYQIVSLLGSGGMGIVYEARDPRLKRTVAIKLLPTDLTKNATAKQRFLQEAQAASALDHPNICTIHEINETDDGQLYLVMAHYEGETLKERISKGPLALDDAIDIATQVGQGLVEASPWRGHRASGHQAREPAGHQDGRGEDPRLRPGQLAGSEGVLMSGVRDMIGPCSQGHETGSSARSSRSAFMARSRATSTTPMRTIPRGRW